MIRCSLSVKTFLGGVGVKFPISCTITADGTVVLLSSSAIQNVNGNNQTYFHKMVFQFSISRGRLQKDGNTFITFTFTYGVNFLIPFKLKWHIRF